MFQRVVNGGGSRRGLERSTVTRDSFQEQNQLPQTGLLEHKEKQQTKNHQAFKENQHHERQAPSPVSISMNA